MPESRGAASVTLDTIIANVLGGYLDSHEARDAAAEVTDALLAKGEIRYLADGGTITRNKLREWHPPVICILPERKS